MSRWFNPDRSIHEPQFGEEIFLIGPSGLPNGLIAKVRSVVSEDLDEDIYEVVDSYNRTRYISATAEGTWVEVEIE